MEIKTFVLRRKKLLGEIIKRFYKREILNKEIKDIKKELDSLDRVLLSGEIIKGKIKIKMIK